MINHQSKGGKSQAPGVEPLTHRLPWSGAVEAQWLASELARQLGTWVVSEGAERGRGCLITCDPVYGRVVVDGNGWRLTLTYEGERFAVAYDGGFDLIAARARILAERLELLLVTLSRNERLMLWQVRQRMGQEPTPIAT